MERRMGRKKWQIVIGEPINCTCELHSIQPEATKKRTQAFSIYRASNLLEQQKK